MDILVTDRFHLFESSDGGDNGQPVHRFDDLRQPLSIQGVILDDGDADQFGAHNSTLVPFPGEELMTAVPPTSDSLATIECLMPKPSVNVAGSNPVPWSRTTNRMPVLSASRLTTTRSTPAYLSTLVSASRSAPKSASDTSRGARDICVNERQIDTQSVPGVLVGKILHGQNEAGNSVVSSGDGSS